ncbi:helix-turn-helix domain-containing protein [Rubrobacter xylanophilus]|uniref:helix-turn-helix domain-containing protein n=1 Tax=Rubrobacter xylanophilus TaxID=49319 RepID=UPI001C63EBE5|nr:helix-turn-helix domain-containing protein [Rubrobacter xylanophilus]
MRSPLVEGDPYRREIMDLMAPTVTNCQPRRLDEVQCSEICLRPGVFSMDEKPDDVLTIGELSAYLKIPKSTLYKLVREGKVPSQKIGRHWRFRKEAIDRWLEEAHTDTKG